MQVDPHNFVRFQAWQKQVYIIMNMYTQYYNMYLKHT